MTRKRPKFPFAAVSRPLLLVVVGAWIIAGLLLAFFEAPLFEALWVVALALWPLYALAGVVLLIVAALRLRAGEHGAPFAIGIVVACGIGLWFTARPIARAGDHWIFQRRFARMRLAYERIIREVGQQSVSTASTRRDNRELYGVPFVIDRGPPTRVAFPQPGGILDNWEGIVYDSTGAIAAATGWQDGVPGRFSAPRNVVKLFGGDLVGCEPIGDWFYRCWFT
jgi:hypothetical protein